MSATGLTDAAAQFTRRLAVATQELLSSGGTDIVQRCLPVPACRLRVSKINLVYVEYGELALTSPA